MITYPHTPSLSLSLSLSYKYTHAITDSQSLTLSLSLSLSLCLSPILLQVILWCADWGSFSLNKCGGDQKAIAASYTLLVESLKATSPELMSRVRVMIQSEALLANPSDYWISVINVGRKYNLQKVLDAESDTGSEYAGQVVSSLMHVADCIAVAPTVICCQPSQAGLAKLCVDYYTEAEITEIKAPSVQEVPIVDSVLKPPHMQEGPANADDNIFVLDQSMDVGRKMKRAFCEPQNVTHCPPLVLCEAAVLKQGQALTISRKPENGGDRTYSTIEELRGDFESGALHPGDLKPAVTKAVDAFMQKIRDHIKATDVAKKAETEMKNYIKKASKDKKKK